MTKSLGNPVVFVLLYILFMLPTYVLPFFGSNSAALNALHAAANSGGTMFFFLHAASLGVLVFLTWCRGQAIERTWLIIFPILAALFDLVPGLNWIMLIPTILHILCMVLGVALSAPQKIVNIQTS